jgi:hypothetical protein
VAEGDYVHLSRDIIEAVECCTRRTAQADARGEPGDLVSVLRGLLA